jgi:plastocyanin
MRPHTIAARDGSWTTGVIQPGATASVTIPKTGTYEYICQDHPWSIGQLIVE